MTYKIIDGKILSFVVLILLLSIAFVGTASAATLTVDDSGSADYTVIQDAIDNANNGDTVLVHSGTYYEKIIVDKQLVLQGVDNGEGKPAVNAGGIGNVITISHDKVTLDGFTVTNGTIGIYVTSNNNDIKNNIAEYNKGIRGVDSNTESGGDGGNVYGIFLLDSNKNSLTDNIVQNNTGGTGGDTLEYSYGMGGGTGGNSYGIYLKTSSSNMLSGNIIKYHYGGNGGAGNIGIWSDLGDGGNVYGIFINASHNNKLILNIIEKNHGGTGGQNRGYGINPNGGDIYAIYFKDSNINTIINNIVDSNIGGNSGNSFSTRIPGKSYGIYLDSSQHNIITNNKFQNNEGGKGPRSSHLTSPSSVKGIYLIYSNNNTFTDNIIQNQGGGTGDMPHGIQLSNSDFNIFKDNIIQNQIGGNGEKSSGDGGNGGSIYNIHLTFSDFNTFIDNTIQNNTAGNGGSTAGRRRSDRGRIKSGDGGNSYGIYLSDSSNNNFSGNVAQNNRGGSAGSANGRFSVRGSDGRDYGIYISSSANNNIFNNYFNNSNNYYIDLSSNTWNITKTSARNILNGPTLGGNFWANPEGTGFSQTCTVTYIDGICDSPYILNGNNIDYMPLSEDFAPDAIPPVTSIDFLGELGNNNWYVSDVQVILNATDNEGGLGVKDTDFSFDGTNWNTYTTPLTIIDEGITTVYYKSTDNIGNVEQVKNHTVKIDKTPPTITSIAVTLPNSNDWYNTDVTVNFTASDEISGIDTTTPDTKIITEGINRSVTGVAIDMAGNSARTTISGINIDKTLPEITINSPANETEYLLNQFMTADWSVIDTLSGLALASGTLPTGEQIDTSKVGLKIFSVIATDNADNTAVQNSTFKVVYDFSGILPPVKADGSSVFKSGRTVPVKFRIVDAGGDPVSDAMVELTYQSINDDGTLGEELEAMSTSSASEGNEFRDGSLYIFNMNTKGMEVGKYQFNINLDDGTVKTVKFSIKL